MSINEIRDLSLKAIIKEYQFLRKKTIIQWNAWKKKNIYSDLETN